MMTLEELVGRDARWLQPAAMKMEFELRVDDTVASTLRFRSSFGSFATAESAEGCWTFKRQGFWQTRAVVRAAGEETDLAVFRNNTWTHGGTLELPAGRRFSANSNFWRTQFGFTSEAGAPLVTYRNIGGILHSSARVEVHTGIRDAGGLPWIVALGWYLTVMMRSDAASAAAAAG